MLAAGCSVIIIFCPFVILCNFLSMRLSGFLFFCLTVSFQLLRKSISFVRWLKSFLLLSITALRLLKSFQRSPITTLRCSISFLRSFITTLRCLISFLRLFIFILRRFIPNYGFELKLRYLLVLRSNLNVHSSLFFF